MLPFDQTSDDVDKYLFHTVEIQKTTNDEDGAFINRRAYDRQGQAASGEVPAGEIVHGGHFHSHTICLLNLLEYALAAQDGELLGFCRRSYEWARLQGSTLTGYFPTVINPHWLTDRGLPYSGILAP